MGKSLWYHLDTYKVGQYIKEKVLQDERVKYTDDIVEDVRINKHGFLHSIVTKGGKSRR